MAPPDPDSYLARIGLDPGAVATPDRDALQRLQRAHVTSVPFETLAITGDPHGDRAGEGVTLTLPHLYEKIVERERGGFCFELNGLFGWLLAALGFDVDRVAARVDDAPPANHHSHLVHLDRTYVVDVGLGGTRLRRPLPLDGTSVSDSAGITWRVVRSERPDVDYVVAARDPGEDAWSDRYVLDATPRPLSYFEATCDYLGTAPESPFTGDPSVSLATEEGRKKLAPETLTRFVDGTERVEPVDPGEWYDVLEAEFGVAYQE